MIASALLWSVQTVRLGHHAKGGYEATDLARDQLIALAVLSSLWLGCSTAFSQTTQSPGGSLVSPSTGFLPWIAALWPAVGPWGLGTALQVIICSYHNTHLCAHCDTGIPGLAR